MVTAGNVTDVTANPYKIRRAASVTEDHHEISTGKTKERIPRGSMFHDRNKKNQEGKTGNGRMCVSSVNKRIRRGSVCSRAASNRGPYSILYKLPQHTHTHTHWWDKYIYII